MPITVKLHIQSSSRLPWCYGNHNKAAVSAVVSDFTCSIQRNRGLLHAHLAIVCPSVRIYVAISAYPPVRVFRVV